MIKSYSLHVTTSPRPRELTWQPLSQGSRVQSAPGERERSNYWNSLKLLVCSALCVKGLKTIALSPGSLLHALLL